MSRSRAFIAVFWYLVLGSIGGYARAGDLNPPPGPVAATQRRLISALPLTINQPGSYVLTGTLAGTAGITINVSDVSIDLNGFALVGVGGTADAISAAATIRNITITNGVIRDWGFGGVYVPNATNCEIRHLKIYNSNVEALVVGNNSRITDCTIDGALNTTKGIFAADNCEILNCVCTGCVVYGFQAGTHSVITNCVARQNTSFGIQTGDRSVVSGCTASGNDLIGITAGGGSTVSNSSASANGTTGIVVTTGSTVIGCTATGNGTAPTGGHGISIGTGSSVITCTTANNGPGAGGGSGIVMADRCAVTGCSSSGNRGDGIRVTGRSSSVIGNTCTANTSPMGAAGIRVLAAVSGVRIDGNHVAGNENGLDVGGTGNSIFRNTAADNTNNYGLVVPGNDMGPIGTAAASTSPWANLDQ